jgi:hypothetical protein
MKLTRVNPDHSWLLETNGLRILIDPWLAGPEVDGWGWFHTQHLPEAAWPLEALGSLDGILVTLPFSDHCHKESLRALPAHIPLLATPDALRRLRRIFPTGRTLVALGDPFFSTDALPGVSFTHLSAPWWRPTHQAVWISSPDGSLLVAPHGYHGRKRLRALRPAMARPCTVLAPSMRYGLPFFLGGPVNLGLQNASHLCQDVHANVYLETHSADKPGSGLARLLARIHRPPFERVQSVIAIAAEVPYRQPKP